MDSQVETVSLARAREISLTLYPHQVEGLAFLLGRRRSILADDMGLGKTRQSILGLTEATDGGPYMVVCPASVKRNWVREILMVLPEAETHIAGPAPVPGPGFRGWLVLNYDILHRQVDALLAHDWKALVFDEAHYLKNHRSIRSRTATRIVAEAAGNPVVHVLTGTPLTNRPRDLFPLLQLVRHSLGRSFLSFSRRYCNGHRNDYGYWESSGASNVQELSVQLHGTMLRRTKAEVLDLPAKVRTWIDIDVPQRAVDRMNEAVARFLGPDAERAPRGYRIGVGQLQGARRIMAAVKARQTLEFAKGAVEQGEKVLLFSGFVNPIERFAKHFGNQAVVISGEVPQSRRQILVDRFQEEEEVRVYVGQIHAGGMGVNLTAASQVIFNDLDWVPANHFQAEDRAHRIGQTGTVNVTYMIARGTIEEFVRTVLETKAQLVDDVVEGRSLAPDLDTDVLAELKRMLKVLGRHIETVEGDLSAEDLLLRLREASNAYLEDQGRVQPELRAALTPVSDQAILALASVLTGPRRRLFQAPSARQAGRFYRLEVVGADIACECKGFSYRGTCTHVRELKTCLVTGAKLPDGFERIE